MSIVKPDAVWLPEPGHWVLPAATHPQVERAYTLDGAPTDAEVTSEWYEQYPNSYGNNLLTKAPGCSWHSPNYIERKKAQRKEAGKFTNAWLGAWSTAGARRFAEQSSHVAPSSSWLLVAVPRVHTGTSSGASEVWEIQSSTNWSLFGGPGIRTHSFPSPLKFLF